MLIRSRQHSAKKYIQDDSVCVLNHGNTLGDEYFAYDKTRIEPVLPLTEHYTVRKDEFDLAIWSELVATYRTLRREDAVKLVIVDLDDTLWRGVAVEECDVASHATEGWPLALMEALCFLKTKSPLAVSAWMTS
jgi:hypothetical protein